MLSRFSVKKPYMVLVGVIIALVLGGVSLHSLKTDLLPEMDLPYLAVITVDAGASPEQVETEVTGVLEGPLSTITGVESWQSISAENYSLIFLQFADGTDMDSALVKVSAAANEAASLLPETASPPTYLEISMDMLATMYIGVNDENRDLAELSEYVQDSVVPALERQEGVADVALTGAVVNTTTIELNEYKIQLVNDGILGQVNSSLAESRAALDQASSALDSAEAQVKEAQQQLDAQQREAAGQLADASEAVTTLIATKSAYQAQITVLQMQQAMSTDPAEQAKLAMQIAQLQMIVDQIDAQAAGAYNSADSAKTGAILTMAEARNQLDDALTQIASNRAEVQNGYSQLAEAEEQARSQANIDALLDINTLAQLINAQNLEMPAGYIDDADDNQWMVKVGEEYSSPDELRAMVLTHIDGLGDITLDDVADVIVTNNLGDSYANLNGKDGLVLSVTKTSTANTGDVSKVVNAEIERIEAENEGLDLVEVMDQGDYITLYITTILRSLLLGALLAVIVLALFLRDVRPTIIVAFAIPFSVLLALVFMYFSNLELNIMTLGAMSLSIGMLVDNSIVVMENIYRLRGRGIPAPRAAAQGARQVSGAVVASTITTICVFAPMVFTSGTVRELLVPFALVIGYVLFASLLVALSAVPAIASKLFARSAQEDKNKIGRFKTLYGRALAWCLRFKAPVLILAVVLLAGAIAAVVHMGVVLLPNMTSDQVTITLEMPEDMEKDEAFEVADIAVERISQIEGVADVGCVDSGFTAGLVTTAAQGSDTYSGVFIIYGMVDEEIIKTEKQMKELSVSATEACSDLGCTVYSSDSMGNMSELFDAGLTLEVTGESQESTMEAADMVMAEIETVEGYSNVSNGQEDADGTLRIRFDKDKVARMGTTVGQIYAALAGDLSTSAKAFTLTTDDGEHMDVMIDDKEYIGLTRENVMDWTFEDSNGKAHKLSEVATLTEEPGLEAVYRQDGAYYMQVSADIDDGYNTTLLIRELTPKLDALELPRGCQVDVAGTDETISDMLRQMSELLILGFLLVYLVMVAQFGSLLSPFIIIFTVPLAFTGGLGALLLTGEHLSMMSLLGFVILMGTVVNNGIVFVDYVNQLRLGGMAKRPALIAAGRTRMRPILMTALTTILAMGAMIFSQRIGSSMERGMALVVAGGLLYATVMTLFVVPVIYDLFSRKPLRPVILGSDIDDAINDAEEFIAEMGPEARETYEYETRRQRRKRLKMEGGAHGKGHLRKEELAAAAAAGELPADTESSDGSEPREDASSSHPTSAELAPSALEQSPDESDALDYAAPQIAAEDPAPADESSEDAD